MSNRILIVDDEPSMALAMAEVLRRKQYEVDIVNCGQDALGALARQPYGVIFSDLRMPGLDGHQLLRKIKTLSPTTTVVMVTAFATVESAVSCVRDGAMDYLMKPFSPEALEKAAATAMQRCAIDHTAGEENEIIAIDPAIVSSLELARKAASSNVTVLLEAESGAGKEVFARFIHRESPRNFGPFVAINCAALPRELLEAELFGHSRGAFTGAHRDRKGHFQLADGGTLLLDEIAEMNPDLQARLLRVLQDRVIQPIGSDQTVRVDVRVIAATNKNLREEMTAGRFREDLYYRLRVLPISIPPLRHRQADIEPLAGRFAQQYGGCDTQVTPRALRALCDHSWPGNVRELQNAMQRAAILAGDATIDIEHLDLEPAPAMNRGQGFMTPLSLVDAERETIRKILVETKGNRSEAAAVLGISPRTLRHKLKRFRDAGTPVMEAT